MKNIIITLSFVLAISVSVSAQSIEQKTKLVNAAQKYVDVHPTDTKAFQLLSIARDKVSQQNTPLSRAFKAYFATISPEFKQAMKLRRKKVGK